MDAFAKFDEVMKYLRIGLDKSIKTTILVSFMKDEDNILGASGYVFKADAYVGDDPLLPHACGLEALNIEDALDNLLYELKAADEVEVSD